MTMMAKDSFFPKKHRCAQSLPHSKTQHQAEKRQVRAKGMT
jgi:hypothetical protein